MVAQAQHTMFTRPKYMKVRVKAFLGNGNTKIVNLINVPSIEKIGHLKRVLHSILEVNMMRMLIFRVPDEYDDECENVRLSLCEDDNTTVSNELLLFIRTNLNSHVRNLAFRPFSSRGRNRLTRIDYNYTPDRI